MYEWQAVDEDRYIVATLLATFNGYLIGNLKLVLTPLLCIKELYPDILSVICLQRIQITKFLGFFKACATFQVQQNAVKLGFCKLRATIKLQLSTVVLLQLAFEVLSEIFFLLDYNTLITILNKSSN